MKTKFSEAQKINRPTYEEFKKEALKRTGVREEYESLKPVFELKKQMIKARLESNLTQEDMASMLNTKKSNISRLESPNSRHLPNLYTLIEYAKAVGFNIEINLKK